MTPSSRSERYAEPILSAYPEEQDKLDGRLEEEIEVWKEIKAVLDHKGYQLRTRLVEGMPDIYLEKTS